MGRIPLDTTRIPQRMAGPNLTPENLGQAKIAGKLQESQAVLNGVQQVAQTGASVVGKLVTDRRVADSAADEAAFSMFSKRTMTNAKVAAEKTTNKKDVEMIYANAEKQIKSYLDGTDRETGVANVRWLDHRAQLTNTLKPLTARLHEMKELRGMEIDKANSVAKVSMLQADAVATEDPKSVTLLRDTLDMLDIHTASEKKQIIQETEQKIAEKQKSRVYNSVMEVATDLQYKLSDGQIDGNQFMDELNDLYDKSSGAHKDHQPILRQRIRSMMNSHMRKQQKEDFAKINEITAAIEKGDLDDDSLQYAFNTIFDTPEQVAAVAESTLQELDTPQDPMMLKIVEQAISGQKDGEPYPIGDAVRDMNEHSPERAMLGRAMLMGAMVAPDSGVDPKDYYGNFYVRKDTFGWGKWNKAVTVDPDSMMVDVVKKMGRYIGGGTEYTNRESKWVEKTFMKSLKIIGNDKLDDSEKREKINDLYKKRAKDALRLQAQGGLKVGEIRENTATGEKFKYLGGRWDSQSNWERVE